MDLCQHHSYNGIIQGYIHYHSMLWPEAKIMPKIVRTNVLYKERIISFLDLMYYLAKNDTIFDQS